MKQIHTKHGPIRVPNETPKHIRNILKDATPVTSWQFIYTGNNPNGDDLDDDGRETFLRSYGAWDDRYEDEKDEDIDGLLVRSERAEEAWIGNMDACAQLEETTGIYGMQTKRGRLTYHVQRHTSQPSSSFGYHINCSYRFISLEKTQ